MPDNKDARQKGFSPVVGLLALIAVLLIIFIGFYIYNSTKKTNDTYSQADAISQGSAQNALSNHSVTDATTQYFTIKEWGVRVPYIGPPTLQYSFDSADTAQRTALFNSSELVKADPEACSSPSTVGIIKRYMPDEMVEGEGPDVPAVSATEYAAKSDKLTYAKLGNYYYFVHSSQAACSDKDSAQKLQLQAYQALKSLLPKLSIGQ